MNKGFDPVDSGSSHPAGRRLRGLLKDIVVGRVTVQWSGLVLRTVIPVADPLSVALRLVDESSVSTMFDDESMPARSGCATRASAIAIVKTVSRGPKERGSLTC